MTHEEFSSDNKTDKFDGFMIIESCNDAHDNVYFANIPKIDTNGEYPLVLTGILVLEEALDKPFDTSLHHR